MWVTLEQTSTIAAAVAPAVVAGPSHIPTPIHHHQCDIKRSQTLAPRSAAHPISSSSPRARFAENPIIGPTRDPNNNSQLVRRKSALKSRPTSQLILQPTNSLALNVHHHHQSIDPPPPPPSSSSLSIPTPHELLLPPSSSNHHHRSKSLISADHPHHPPKTLPPSLNVENFDPFHSHQRAHSMSDFHSSSSDPSNQLLFKTLDLTRIKTLSNPSISHPFRGEGGGDGSYPHLHNMNNDTFLDHPHTAHSNLMMEFLPSKPVDLDQDFASTVYESLSLDSEHSGLPSALSSASSSFASSILDHYTSSPSTPPPRPQTSSSSSQDSGDPQNQLSNHGKPKLIPIHTDGDDDDEGTDAKSPMLPHSFVSFNPGSQNPVGLGQLLPSHPISEPLISPLERLSFVSQSRPTNPTRRRSGTVLPPKKPELILEYPSQDSGIPLSVHSIPIQSGPIKPPVRPPRSSRRGNPPLKSAAGVGSKVPKDSLHRSTGSENPPSHPEPPSPLFHDPAPPFSAPSAPVALQHRPQPAAGKDERNLDPQIDRFAASGPRSVDRRDSLHPAALPDEKVSRGVEGSVPWRDFEHPPLGGGGRTDDETDEFASAEEGDEMFWSTAEEISSDDISSHSGTHKASSPSQPVLSVNHHPSSGLEEIERHDHDGRGAIQRETAAHRVRPIMIGAFPRSESYPESLTSSPNISSRPVFRNHSLNSIEEPLSESYEEELELGLETLDLDDLQPHPIPSAIPITRLRSKYLNEKKLPPIPSGDSKSTRETSTSSIPEQHASTQNQDLAGGLNHPNHLTKPSIPKFPFQHPAISRSSSLEGLAALRKSSSDSPPSPKKKSSVRSVHLRQLSKILSFCARDLAFPEDHSSDAQSIAISNDFPTKPKNKPASSPTPPVTLNLREASSSQTVPSTSWKSSMSSSGYENLLKLYGHLEMRRQELIWELCETELSFAVGLRQVIEIFASPLRTSEGDWISGVPMEVGKLMDWLEDILNVHAQIGFQAKNCRQYQTKSLGLVVHISEVFLDLIPRLEVYQPYLIRFTSTTNAIEQMVASLDNDFGEFVRIQSSLPECGRMSLTSFLLKPIQRLMKYPLFFKQLCEVTPPDHPDHEASLRLLNSTDSMIRVLQEVKEREDEYERLQVWESRLKGVPSGFRLTRRDRRLLAQGLLKRVQIPSHDSHYLRVASSHSTNLYSIPTQRTHSAQTLDLPEPMLSSGSMAMINSYSNHSTQSARGRTSLSLVDSGCPAVPKNGSARLSYHRHRQDDNHDRENKPMDLSSYRSLTRQNPFPVGSPGYYQWLDLNQTDRSKRSMEVLEESRHYVRSSICQPQHGRMMNDRSHPLVGTGESRMSGIGSSETTRNRRRSIQINRSAIRKPKESPIHVFVFSDLVLLATRHSDGVRLIRSSKLQKRRKDSISSSYFCLLEDVGISRLIAVTDVSGELDYFHLLKLELLPCFGPGGHASSREAPVSIFLTFPDRGSNGNESVLNKHESVQKEKYRWIAAFNQSLQSRSLSLMGSSKDEAEEEFAGRGDDDDDDDDGDGDGDRERGEEEQSKNQQHQNGSRRSRLAPVDSIRAQERRERTWWSIRHKLVARELEEIESRQNEDDDRRGKGTKSSSSERRRSHLNPAPAPPHHQQTQAEPQSDRLDHYHPHDPRVDGCNRTRTKSINHTLNTTSINAANPHYPVVRPRKKNDDRSIEDRSGGTRLDRLEGIIDDWKENAQDDEYRGLGLNLGF